MNTDKAYLLGLVIGGGCFSSDCSSFSIKLSYKQWGDVGKNPERAGVIAEDIIHVVKPLMEIEYGLSVSYTTGSTWIIKFYGNTARLIEDLEEVGIKPSTVIHKTADISILETKLIDTNLKRRFIAGIADTIGSMAPSHRRFSDDVQIISFEISGYNYRLVCQLCNMLYSIGCRPDQILWQHPNMQSGKDAYFKSWKKGNKLRVTLDSFSSFGSLAFKSKVLASKENLVREERPKYEISSCEEKELSVSSVVSVHVDEYSDEIPEEIRGCHFIHHKQFCAAINCPHAPYKKLDELLSKAENYVSPFTVLHKGSVSDIRSIVSGDILLSKRVYYKKIVSVKDVFRARKQQTISFRSDEVSFSPVKTKGYPISVFLDACAYIIASQTGKLNGKRPIGRRDDIILDRIDLNPSFSIDCYVPDLLTPIVLTDGKVAAIVGPLNSKAYKRLISYQSNNKYKMMVRPITEDDLR